jgi:hypothetical protein
MCSDHPDDLTPAQTDAVRRALRAARHDAPLPDDVAARLEATLAGLVAERAAAEPGPAAASATVVPLRRRRWPAYLAAAAAVTAIGLAGTQLVDRGGHDSVGASTADRAEQGPSAALAPDASPETMATLGSTALGLTRAQLDRLADAGYTGVDPVGLPASAYCSTCSTADSLRHADAAPDQKSSLQKQYAAASPASCHAALPPSLGDAPAHLATHDGEPVLLVVVPDAEGTVVRAWPCSGGPATTIRLG